MKTLKAASAMLLAFGLSSVQAAPVVTLSTLGETATTVAGATTIDFNSGCGYASCTGDFEIQLGSLSGKYAQPAGTNTPFLTVPNPYANGTASFGLGSVANYFGLFWGSIDSYNSIMFKNGATVLANYSGTDIVGAFANGNQLNFNSNRFINFNFGSDLFDTVVLSSTNYAFESDNHAYALIPSQQQTVSTPEPAAALLLLLGLVGLSWKKSNA